MTRKPRTHQGTTTQSRERVAMETSSIMFLLVVVTLVILIEAKPTRNTGPHGHQVHCSKVRGRHCAEDGECACLSRHNATLICNYERRCQKAGFIDEIMRNQPCPKVFKSYCEVNADCPCSEQPLMCEEHECVKAKCSKIRGRQCVDDTACACVNHRNTTNFNTLICNQEHRCERRGAQLRETSFKLFKEIMRIQPCPGVFKRRCSVNSDCPCNEHPLICEERECVKAKLKLKRA